MMTFHAAKNGENMLFSSYVVKQINKEEIKIYDRHSLNEAKIPKENLNKLNLDKIRYGPVDYVDIAITGKCNLKCKHCYQGDQKYSYEIDYKTIEKIVYDAYDLGVIGIVLTGGEPTLHPNFVDIIKLLDELNFRWTLVTNGNYNNKLNKYILKYKPVEVAFSLDGLKPEYEKFRIGGDWNKIIENIKTISKEVITQVNCTLNKYTNNTKYLEKFEKFVKEVLNVDKITYIPIGFEGYAKKNKEIIPKKIKFPKGIYNRNDKYYTCSFFYNKLTINYDGSIYPCMFFREIEYYRLGNVYENSLKEIYYKLISKNVIPKPIEYLIKKECINCTHSNECGGGCQGRALTMNGYVGSKDLCVCDIYKNKYPTMFPKPNFDKLIELYKYKKLPKNLEELYLKVIEILKELNVNKVLDVGCGSGFFMDLAKKEFDIYGIDSSKEMVETTNKKHPGKVFYCDILEYSPKIKYDATTCLYSFFCHFTTIEKIKEVIKKIRTISRYLIFDVLDVNKLPIESEIKHENYREYVYRDKKFVYSFKIIDEKYYYSISYPIIEWNEFLKEFGKIVKKEPLNKYREIYVLEFNS